MEANLTRNIEEQRGLLTNPQPELNLVRPCRLNDGILLLSDQERTEAIQHFIHNNKQVGYFIPASGSGSRMFQFLFEFLKKPNASNAGLVERFVNHIADFACFYQLPEDIQQRIRLGEMELEAFAGYILNNKGFGLAHLPKALIPFHKFGPFLLNPIHEHVLQGIEVAGKNCVFHFTIQEKFKTYIQSNLVNLEGLTSNKFQVNYSCQNPESNAVAFDMDLNPVLDENGSLITRPAGHGALLENFSSLNLDLVFIKNIDNIQHFSKSKLAIEIQQVLGGMFLQIQEAILDLLTDYTIEKLLAFNHRYQLFGQDVLTHEKSDIQQLLQRPLRVCGMVKNEGQPGGGPFWVENNGVVSKQIVEKAQISPKPDQVRIMIQSTHFNPVIMVCQGRNQDGSAIDFNQYRDDNAYFKVTKTQLGKDIQFTELPGLWNGSMAEWNTVFVEIPSETFSPVKTVLDLLDTPHLGH